MEAPPVWVFRGLGLLIGFIVGYFILFKPKRRPEE